MHLSECGTRGDMIGSSCYFLHGLHRHSATEIEKVQQEEQCKRCTRTAQSGIENGLCSHHVLALVLIKLDGEEF